MRDFITCLEFLTRLRFSNRTSWKDDDFSRSIPYFPLVGLVIGIFLCYVNHFLVYIDTPAFLRAAGLILSEVLFTGELIYDGFMDTADGIFSARSREHMLEIMRDSHVGANAVIALVCMVLLKVAAYISINGGELSRVLVAMSVATRTFMVNYIVNFEYARKTGIGHMFARYSRPIYFYIAAVLGLIIILTCGLTYLCAAVVTFVVCLGIAWYLSNKLGGLTGDTYGFLTETGNVIYLIIAFYLLR